MEGIHCKPAFERADPERQRVVIETGIDQFAQFGFENANINVIAKKAGISIGLMYKYFETKEDLFITCMNASIEALKETLDAVVNSNDKILERGEKLIRHIQKTSGKDSQYVKLYNEVTKLSEDKNVEYFAKKIESISHDAYSSFLKKAQEEGYIRSDCNTEVFAYFFDSLLMNLQFAYTCDYYRERLKIYCGDNIFENDEVIVQELLKFLESAFTFSHNDIKALESTIGHS
ncbi:MAG: TetR/AcrR family transcriptional regulator [Clostridia bacterium]|nr:TetR/AcrR family transcriptional regulator [Clostridia bacterium]